LEVTAMLADDSLFEKALARQLRNVAQGNPTSGRQAGSENEGEFSVDGVTLRGACPDAEMLAAYHEGGLSSEEMRVSKEHIISCARCREILAQLEATDDVVAANDDEWRILADSDGGGLSRSAPHPAVSKSARRRMSLWIAPAGAIAAALLLWLGLHLRTTDRIMSSRAVQEIAENREGPPPIAAPSTPGLVEKGKSAQLDAKSNAEAKRQATDTSSRGRADLHERTAPSGALRGSAQQPLSGDELKQNQNQIQNQNQNQNQVRNQIQNQDQAAATIPATPSPDVGAAAGKAAPAPPPPAVTQTVTVTAGAAPVETANDKVAVAPGSAGAETGAQDVTAASAPAASKDAEEIKKEAAPALMSAQAAPMNGRNFKTLTRVANVDPHFIPAPGGNVIWRVGVKGLIEFSSDGGAKWKRQNSGVDVPLNAGSAPSSAVCWVVGRAGTILLTIDGGAHWTRVVSPLSADLSVIHAADALHATIWDVAKGVNVATSDGGVTWTSVVKP
jgi:hypothetical protein